LKRRRSQLVPCLLEERKQQQHMSKEKIIKKRRLHLGKKVKKWVRGEGG